MDKNTITGFVLIFLLMIGYQLYLAPSQEQLEAEKRTRDSLAQIEQQLLDKPAQEKAKPLTPAEQVAELPDSLKQIQLGGIYGPFSQAAIGQEAEQVLENELIKVTFSNKGGRVKQVELKNHKKLIRQPDGTDVAVPLLLLEDEKNKFDYILPVAGMNKGVSTHELYFEPQAEGKAIAYRLSAGGDKYFEQQYELRPNSYQIDYKVKFVGLQDVLANGAQSVRLNWVNYLDKLEHNTNFERNYSTTYFKPAEASTDYCSCTANDTEDLSGKPLKWVSNTNQFFNTTLVAETSFNGAVMSTEVYEAGSEDLKKLVSDIQIPYAHSPSETFAMTMYTGSNEFERLREVGHELSDIIPFGWSIFGTINRWVIRPIFNFLSSFIGNMGIVILVLTFLVKMVLYPLTYKMLYSQSKMSALKPQIEKVKEKHKDDAQAQQVETMKMYREFGVNPLGGCMPMLLQMPIWFALYRFFPASIDFRQASFLWAADLSSYDEFVQLPFTLPLGFGAHISLFTILWAVSTLAYTYYNSQHMDMSANPAMKYMQYFMPIMFIGFFNSYASGLTCYLLFSNLVNVGQTIVTKNFIIDEDKIRAILEENKKKPKKKSGFQERLEAAMNEQKRAQAERDQQKKKGKK